MNEKQPLENSATVSEQNPMDVIAHNYGHKTKGFKNRLYALSKGDLQRLMMHFLEYPFNTENVRFYSERDKIMFLAAIEILDLKFSMFHHTLMEKAAKMADSANKPKEKANDAI